MYKISLFAHLMSPLGMDTCYAQDATDDVATCPKGRYSEGLKGSGF